MKDHFLILAGFKPKIDSSYLSLMKIHLYLQIERTLYIYTLKMLFPFILSSEQIALLSTMAYLITSSGILV